MSQIEALAKILKDLPPPYKGRLKARLKQLKEQQDSQGTALLIKSVSNLLAQLAQLGLPTDLSPMQIFDAQKHSNLGKKLIKNKLLQKLELLDFLLCHHKNDRSIVGPLAIRVHKRLEAYTKKGLAAITPPYSASNLLKLRKKEAQKARADLQLRIKGICDYYQKDCGYSALAAVITTGTEHQYFNRNLLARHPNSVPLLTPKDAHQALQENWRRFRAALAHRGISLKGLISCEPNQIGLPHFNLLLFFKTPREMDIAVELINRYFREPNDASNRIMIERDTEEPLRWAYYITKNARQKSTHNDADDIKKQEEIDLWHQIWNIRKFNFLGQKSIYIFRTLQRLSKKTLRQFAHRPKLSPAFLKLWSACSAQRLGNEKTVYRYDYRVFLLMTESDHIDDASHNNPQFSFKRHQLHQGKNNFDLAVTDSSRPQLRLFLRHQRTQLEGWLTKKKKKCRYVYHKYLVHLLVILPRSILHRKVHDATYAFI